MLLPLLLIAATMPGGLHGLDTLSAAELRAAGDEPDVRTAIARLSACLADRTGQPDCDTGDCAQPSPSACANVAAAAWRAFARRYLALLAADPVVGPAARASQRRWEDSAQADCAVDAAIVEVRDLPYRGFYAEQCAAGAASVRALALRDQVIDLYADAEVQGGRPYPGRPPLSGGR